MIRKINKFIIICKNGELLNDIFNFSLIPKISAIVILYNSELSIKTAIRSIQNQKMIDIEILIIDDNSSDNSLEVIEKLEKKDKRIKIIKNKQNRGCLYSRSIGALNAKGKYIMALDSDDLFISKDIFNICYKEVEENNLDILEFSGFTVKKYILKLNNQLPEIAHYLKFKQHNLYIKQPELFDFLYLKNGSKIIRRVDGYMWGKCLNSKIYVKALNILGEKIYERYHNFGEDRIVNFVLFRIAKSFKYIEEYGILYLNNSLSICNSYKKELLASDELFNIMSILNFTKNTSYLSIPAYEIKHRWKHIIKPGLNEDNKKILKYIINILLISKHIKKNEKNKLKKYLEELQNQ